MAGIRKRDPEVMKQISSFVEEYFFEYHQSPSMQKIAAAIGISKSTAYYYVNEMAEKGMLDYDGKNIETRSMQKSDYKMNRASVLGGIACGSPELTEEDFEEFIALPVALFGEGDFFVYSRLVKQLNSLRIQTVSAFAFLICIQSAPSTLRLSRKQFLTQEESLQLKTTLLQAALVQQLLKLWLSTVRVVHSRCSVIRALQ